MIQALIFDFAGLILDTETPDLQSWQEIYAEHGLTVPLDAWMTGIGRWSDSPPFSPYAYLEAQTGRPVDREQLRARRRPRNVELVHAQPIRPGVEGYIAMGRRLGLKLGVASSSSHEWVDGHLKRIGLWPHFDCVSCSEDVGASKPDPAVYRAALDALGASPAETIAFEDSPVGVLAAKAAGVFCVAVPNPLTRRLAFDQADLMLDSLADLSLPQLVAMVVERGRHVEEAGVQDGGTR